MKNRILIYCLILISYAVTLPAQDQIPQTDGFGGYANGGFTYWKVADNFIVGGSPIVFNNVSASVIESIFEAPSSKYSPGGFVGGEVNYTFSSTRTQIFFGNRLEDLLRMDLVFGLGVRQEIGNAGILAASALFTPVELESWSDPFIEREERQATDLSFPGWRIRWGKVFGTGLELTVTDRYYEYGKESSGDWLVSQGRLDPAQQSLLNRDGDILRIQALYRFHVNGHRFEPMIRWVNDYHRGAAIANRGFSFQLTYLYRISSVVIDANIIYGFRKSKESNPIYNKVKNSDRMAAAMTAFIPVKKFESSILNVFAGIEIFREDTNIEFYDSSVNMVMAGFLWRFIKK
jgi:hypothetical protein